MYPCISYNLWHSWSGQVCQTLTNPLLGKTQQPILEHIPVICLATSVIIYVFLIVHVIATTSSFSIHPKSPVSHQGPIVTQNEGYGRQKLLVCTNNIDENLQNFEKQSEEYMALIFGKKLISYHYQSLIKIISSTYMLIVICNISSLRG